ncbi:MAG: hypothetical protein H0W68_09910, partial [Gemmatimonadaceae bacterium]|nr:hypothetical protein [Gemmatimonadaceae bacterium]
ALACAVAQLVVARRIERVRAAIGGPVDMLDLADARRQAFGRLHAMSVLGLGIASVAALIAAGLLVHHLTQRKTP